MKNKISDKLKGVPVNKTLLSNDGKGCVFLPNEAALDEANNVLSTELSVTKSSKSPPILLPKVCINNMDTQEITSLEVLKDKILQKNLLISQKLKDDTSSKLDVLFIDKKRNKAILKVTHDIHEIIMRTQRIFINLESHYVSDSYHVEQCYHCQGFGHRSTSDRCPKKNLESVCLFCVGSHKSLNCNHKNNKTKQKCSNCNKSNINDIKSSAKTHNAISKNCPMYKKEVDLIKTKTSYDPKNFKTNKKV